MPVVPCSVNFGQIQLSNHEQCTALCNKIGVVIGSAILPQVVHGSPLVRVLQRLIRVLYLFENDIRLVNAA